MIHKVLPSKSNSTGDSTRRLLIVVNVGWFFVSHRLPVAVAAKAAGLDVHVAAALDKQLDRDTRKILRDAGIVFHELRLSRSGAHPIELIRDSFDLWKLFRRLGPDVVHLVSLKPVLVGGFIARLAGMRSVVMAIPGRGSVFSGAGLIAAGRRLLALIAYRAAYRSAVTRVVVQNIEDRDYFISRGIFRSQDMRLIRGSGADVKRFSYTPEVDHDVIVVLASRMLREKGIEDFVLAAKMLKERGCSARFVLVGEPDHGNPRSHSREELESWHADGLIEWWGFRPDMEAVFAACHIVCLPTYYGEGVPKVLIEAAAAGRPIVTTDTAGCRDIVRNGESGLLVEAHSPEQLAHALGRLIENSQLRSTMGQCGRNLVERQFSLDIVIQQTLDVYRELLEGTPDESRSDQ